MRTGSLRDRSMKLAPRLGHSDGRVALPAEFPLVRLEQPLHGPRMGHVTVAALPFGRGAVHDGEPHLIGHIRVALVAESSGGRFQDRSPPSRVGVVAVEALIAAGRRVLDRTPEKFVEIVARSAELARRGRDQLRGASLGRGVAGVATSLGKGGVTRLSKEVGVGRRVRIVALQAVGSVDEDAAVRIEHLVRRGTMAAPAEIRRRALDCSRLRPSMRIVAGGAVPFGHDRMDASFGELLLLICVAGVAELGSALAHQLRRIRSVHIVAPVAVASSNWGVRERESGWRRFGVAVAADLDDRPLQERRIRREVSRVAIAASAVGHRCVPELPIHRPFDLDVTAAAEQQFLCGKETRFTYMRFVAVETSSRQVGRVDRLPDAEARPLLVALQAKDLRSSAQQSQFLRSMRQMASLASLRLDGRMEGPPLRGRRLCRMAAGAEVLSVPLSQGRPIRAMGFVACGARGLHRFVDRSNPLAGGGILVARAA